MTTILFIRHNKSDANAFFHNDPKLQTKINNIPDLFLTKTGRKQAGYVRNYLAGKLLQVFYTSF